MILNLEIKVEEKEINCSCEHFKHMGVLCRHAFTIIMRCCVKEIPERHIMKIWRKDTFSSHESDSRGRENVKLVNDSYYSFKSCLDIVKDDKKKLDLFVDKQQMLLKELESDYTCGGLKSKTDDEVVCKLMVFLFLFQKRLIFMFLKFKAIKVKRHMLILKKNIEYDKDVDNEFLTIYVHVQ
uniref:SWIM-type domain-containing protein n=1 Tax=Lactuca sativa TaxID=4236 RepID=A0A9R1XSQ4_LACSA|nr:hypothetical protein LSAT_V11C100045160 [Lactuca sativa]